MRLLILGWILFVLILSVNTVKAQTTNKVGEFNAMLGIDYNQNFVVNSNAEKNVWDVLWTGASLTRITSGVEKLYGTGSFQWETSGSAGDTLKFLANNVDQGYQDKMCFGYIQYQYGTSFGTGENGFKFYVENSGGTKLSAEVVLQSTFDVSVSNAGKVRTVFTNMFPCPVGNTSRPVVEHTFAGTQFFFTDEIKSMAYTGILAVPDGASFFGGMEQPGGSGCSYPQTSSTATTNFVAQGASTCANNWVATGKVVSTAATNHRASLVTPPAGMYKVVITSAFYNLAAGTCVFRLSDGTTGYQGQVVYSQASSIETPVLNFMVPVNSQMSSNLQLTIESADNQASGCSIDNTNAGATFSWKVYRYPINGQAYSNVIPASLADTAMSWTTGMTIGATTTAPTKGTAAFDRIGYANVSTGAFVRGSLKLSSAGSAGSGDYLITLPGGQQFADGTRYDTTVYGGSAAWSTDAAIGNASIINVSGSIGLGQIIPFDATRFRIGLIIVSNAGTVNRGVWGSGFFELSGGTLNVSFDFWAPMKGRIPTGGAFLGPGMVSSNSTSSLRLEGANISNTQSATAVNTTSTPGWIANTSCSGAGNCVWNITGVFSAAPWCTCSTNNTNANHCEAYNISTTSMQIRTTADPTGTPANENNVKVICFGPR